MAYLDRFLAAMVTSHADLLTLVADDVARMSIANVARPVTKQPLRAAQLRTVLLEVAPPEARDAVGAGGDASFAYAYDHLLYDVRVASGATGQSVEIRPRSAAADASARLTEGAQESAPRAPAMPELRTSGATTIAAEPHDAAPQVSDEIRREIHYLLEQLVTRGASDLHLRVSEPPILRLHGEMSRI